MTTKDAALMKAVASVVREYVGAAWNTVETRLKALEAQPAPRDGAPGPAGEKGLDGQPGPSGELCPVGPPGERGPQGERGERGEPGPSGMDGEKGLQGELGPEGPSGRDGRDGMPGVPGLQGEKGLDGRNGVDGLHGKDGLDGLGFDDLDAVYDEYGRMSLKFTRGEQVKQFRVPGYIDRGVYREGESYEKGDGATFGGGFYIAQQATFSKPGQDGSWRLAVKPGRDGKDFGNPHARTANGLPVVQVGKPR